ncbi:unnamed protein product [Lactuca saligna]|uniref:Dihydrolipoyl dehydrogenase n=1 Tax=Lactuca saligna TaxID=75948 RepID=A0AA35ZKV4_LACSI|nr:unnamed protein product [Lactuca saligna]
MRTSISPPTCEPNTRGGHLPLLPMKYGQLITHHLSLSGFSLPTSITPQTTDASINYDLPVSSFAPHPTLLISLKSTFKLPSQDYRCVKGDNQFVDFSSPLYFYAADRLNARHVFDESLMMILQLAVTKNESNRKMTAYLKSTRISAGDVVGGTCVNRGCVPSKALLAVSCRMRKLKNEHHMKSFGLQVAAAGYDRQGVADHAQNLATKIRNNLTISMKSLGVDILTGFGYVMGPQKVKYGTIGGTETVITDVVEDTLKALELDRVCDSVASFADMVEFLAFDTYTKSKSKPLFKVKLWWLLKA